jgi:hypothetical protein
MTSDLIRPLLKLSNVTVLHLTAPLGFSFDDDFVVAMALSWPKIETLSLAADIYEVDFHSSPRNPTIFSLLSFARHCPNLRHLAMAVDSTNVQTHCPSLSSWIIQMTLESLNLLHSPIGTPVAVAQLLSSIFPRLLAVTGNTLGSGEVKRLVEDGRKLSAS